MHVRRWTLLGVTGLLMFGSSPGQAQDAAIITGRVSADAGRPLPNATVTIEALGLGAISRDDGTYRLLVPAARVGGQRVNVTARLLGFKSTAREITVRPGPLTLDFALVQNPLQLGEVVIRGAGTASAVERLGTERKTVDSTTIRRSNEANVVSALSGKLPNVLVQQQSGEAGASARIQIRGVRSLSGTGQPLFVVDGVPINNATNAMGGNILGSTASPNRAADIVPEDIESIEVLSGPSAAAIYGSMAGNGVILVSTKKGKAGRTAIAVRSSYSMDAITRSLPYQRAFGVGSNGQRPTCVPGGPTNCFLSAGFFSWGAAIPSGTPTFNQVDAVFGDGSSFDNSLSLQGGNDRTTYLLSGGYLSQDGFVTGDHDFYSRSSLRATGSHRASDALTLSSSITYVDTDGNFIGRGNNTNGVLLPALRTPPDFDNRAYLTKDGVHRTWRFPNPAPGQELFNRAFDNPFYVINASEAPQRTARTIGSIAMNWIPLGWLKVNYNLGADFTANDRLEARPYQSGGAPLAGSVSRWQFNQSTLDHNLTAQAEHSFGSRVRASLLVGQQLNQQSFRQVLTVGNSLVAPEPLRLDNTVTTSPPTDAEQRTRLESYFAQAQFDLAHELFLTATARNDGSSTFGLNTNRIWYPQGSVAWTFTERLKVPGLTYGKLRAAYGQSGIVPAPYQLQDVFLGGSNAFVDFNPGSTLVPTLNGIGGLFSSAVRGNQALGPERVSETSTGVDLALLDNRIDANVTYFVQQTRDGIVNFPLPGSSGYTSEVRNAVRMRNLGIEGQINTRPLQGRSWQWEVGGTYALNRNRVQSLGDTTVSFVLVGASFVGRTTNAQVGHPLGVVRGTDFARCRYGDAANVVSGVDINAACRTANAPDGALYVAANGFPVSDPTVRVLGNPSPNYTAGLRSTLTYKRLSVGGFVDVRNGGTVQNMTKASMYQYGTHKDTEIRGQQRTFGQDLQLGGAGPSQFPVVGPGAGQAVTVGESWFSGNGGIGGPASQFQEDGTFVRLREVSLSARFDAPWVRRMTGFGSADVRLAGRNLVLWSDYTGFDPETSLGGGAVITGGFDWFNPPTSRSVVFSIGLNR